MLVLIAPDKFKGTLDAPGAAAAMARGARLALPHARINHVPLGDGGEGTSRALLRGVGGSFHQIDVVGPLGDPVSARIALLSDGRAVAEMATASGLSLVTKGRRRPLDATSRGTGELMKAALRLEPRELLVAVGGSASTDGGTGAASAFGWRFVDRKSADLPFGGGPLTRLHHIGRPVAPLPDLPVIAMCDVDNPMIGPTGAARVFAAQKGASAEEVDRLERGLETLAQRARVDLDIDIGTEARTGAGGGMGGGLKAFFGADLRSGFDVVADAIGLRAMVDEADIVITGEGHLDAASLGGKVPVAVARMAQEAGTPCIAVCGRVSIGESQLHSAGISAAASMVQGTDERTALTAPADILTRTTRDLVERFMTA